MKKPTKIWLEESAGITLEQLQRARAILEENEPSEAMLEPFDDPLEPFDPVKYATSRWWKVSEIPVMLGFLLRKE
jgi:hypothetical protein